AHARLVAELRPVLEPGLRLPAQRDGERDPPQSRQPAAIRVDPPDASLPAAGRARERDRRAVRRPGGARARGELLATAAVEVDNGDLALRRRERDLRAVGRER